MISVIVPVYKVEPYLDRCVQSIVDQTYRDLEIILVDDGSPDNCPGMCDVWAKKDRRIKVIHKSNGGLSDARNVGMTYAKGEYISFVDSDDWIDSRFIEFLFNAVCEHKSELAACDVSFVLDDTIWMEDTTREYSGQLFSTEAALESLIHGRLFRAVAWNKLYLRDILKEESFKVGCLHEDEFFTYRVLAKCKRPVFVAVPLYAYRQREGSITKSYSLKRLDCLDAILERLLFLKREYPALYLEDKVTFCKLCINMYCDILLHSFAEEEIAKKRIKKSRYEIHFNVKELFQYGMKDILYIIGTHPVIIDIVSKIRVKMGYGQKE